MENTQTQTKKRSAGEKAVEWYLILYPSLYAVVIAAFVLFVVDQCRAGG